jgi:hypothetical protein
MKKALSLSILVTPLIASAAFAFPDLRTFANEVAGVMKIVLNILISIAFISFFWGVAKFILSSGNEKSITEGKQFMRYGIFALFVLWTFEAIILYFSGQFEFGDTLQNIRSFLPA